MGYIKDLIFPPKCIFCGEILTRKNSLQSQWRICSLCAKDILNQAGDGTFDSRGSFLDYVIAPLSYQEDKVKRAICHYKFQSKKVYDQTITQIMIQAVLKNELLYQHILGYHIVSVPLSKERMLERGYNQADRLAKMTAQVLEFPYEKDVLIKVRHTNRQSSITSAPARVQNILGAYRTTRQLDDIYTTGSTLNECAKMLKQAGANHIVGWCAAINRDFSLDDFRLTVKENSFI